MRLKILKNQICAKAIKLIAFVEHCLHRLWTFQIDFHCGQHLVLPMIATYLLGRDVLVLWAAIAVEDAQKFERSFQMAKARNVAAYFARSNNC
jgi:hypothetical protein